MKWLLKLLGGPLGSWIASATLLALVTLTAALGVQTWRIDRLKAAPLKATAQAQARVITRIEKQGEITERAGEQAAARQAEIRTITRTIVKEVPRYVPQAADDRCIVPAGFVRLHDAAAAGVPPVPDPAGQSNGAAPGVALSDVAAVVADNYGTALETSAQLVALQDWIRAQQALSAKPP